MGQRLALIIGSSIFLDETLARLKTPDADVGALGDILLDQELGEFDDSKVLVNMSSHIVRREISAFYSKKTRDDLLLLYFSGHGVLDDQGQLYLAVKDTDSKLLRGTAISAHFIAEEMDNSRSQRQVLILDCCHSGAFARGTKGSPGASVGTARAFEGTGYGRVVLTASDATQYAWEGDQVIGKAENSLFTHYLIQGVKTGKADVNQDGRITIDEIYDYVYERVVKQTPRQTPGKWSYKERGEIVFSHAPQVKPKVLDLPPIPEPSQQLDKRLERLYNEGLSAYWLEEWEKAVLCFEAIVDVRPDYPDAQVKLDQSRRTFELSNLYTKASVGRESGDLDSALRDLEELVRLAPDYRDAAEILETVRDEKQLVDLYTEAQRLFDVSQWQAVANVFAQIKSLRVDYPDPKGLLARAEKELHAIQYQAELERLYNQALHKMDAGYWGEAFENLSKIQGMEPDYQEVGRLLARVEIELSKQQETQQKQEQVNSLYEQALGLARARQWYLVQEKLAEINTIAPDFPDPEGIGEKAQQGLTREQQEIQKQNELGSLYAESLRLLQAENYQGALEKWREIQGIDSHFPDREGVAKTARTKLTSIARGKRTYQIPKQVIWVLGGLLFIAAVVVGYKLLPGLFAGSALKVGESIEFTVRSTDSIYLAGRTDLTIPAVGSQDDAFPLKRCAEEGVEETFPVQVSIRPGTSLVFNASGSIRFFQNLKYLWKPDGALSESSLYGLGAISGYNGPSGALVGVFLDDEIPSRESAPDILDFSSAGFGKDFPRLEPDLGQVFFIGDGREWTGFGGSQKFIAPERATRLFLGIADGFNFNGPPGCYDDNDGEYLVTVTNLSSE